MRTIIVPILSLATTFCYAQIDADEIGFKGCGRDIEVSEDEDTGNIIYDFDNGDKMVSDDMFDAMWGVTITYTFESGMMVKGEFTKGVQQANHGYFNTAGDSVSRFTADFNDANLAAIKQTDMADKDLIASTLSMMGDPDQQSEEMRNLAATYTEIAAMQFGTFSNGMTIIYEDGMYGYVNDCFQEVVKPKYENALPFYSEYAWVMQKGKWFKIDKKGKKVK